jgi:hypothetical protein
MLMVDVRSLPVADFSEADVIERLNILIYLLGFKLGPACAIIRGAHGGDSHMFQTTGRFTRHNVQHPTYKALGELGKAVKTVFLCDYLRLEPLRREIHEALQVIETWNSANDFILYGKGGEFASNRLEDQEMLMLSLHLLQVSLVYVNTLRIQQVLAEPAWSGRLTTVDLRALSPLKWQHVNPYGTFTLNMNERLPLAQ